MVDLRANVGDNLWSVFHLPEELMRGFLHGG